ncbi:MAG: SMC-Scp complex subunit ScpB [Nitrospirae bacterium]|nr:MAG: SMC-Scp complex subunit ScpB [Nitrospirota bacterium]
MENVSPKSVIEVLLFIAGEPVSVSSLSKATGLNESDVRQTVNQLASEFKDRDSGILIAEIADGYQMLTVPEMSLWIKKFKNINQSNKLSQPALETLAIIAYKQPITKVEIDQLRGLNSDGAVKSLVDKHLIKIIGKKETPGRPFLYGTTKEFLQYFGLKNLSDLPPINDFLKEEAA